MKRKVVTRKQIAEAFKAAKPYLKKGEIPESPNDCTFICFALAYCKAPAHATDAAAEVIMERLYPCSSVYGWLQQHAGVPGVDITPENLQKYRHRWLDSLIEEFSKG